MKAMMRILSVMLSIAIAMVGMPVMSAKAESAEVLTLPAALTIIEEEAFCGATSIGKVIVPEGTTQIKSRAFADSSLTEISLPASLISIADDTFDGCAEGLAVIAAEGSYAHEWAVANGYIESADTVTDFTYEIADEAVTITGYTGEGGDVVIPATIEGYPVTAIGASVFRGNAAITSVSLPEGLLSIGDLAFYGCNGLTTLTLPASVVELGSNAIISCLNLKEILVAEGNTAYQSQDGVLLSADGATLILYPAAKAGESYAIPEGVVTISYNVFNGSALTTVSLPASVSDITDTSFWNMLALQSITVAEDNLSFACVDGVLFSKEMTRLDKYPAGKQGDLYSVPDGVEIVRTSAFRDNASLKSVYLPGTVKTIGSYAFANCTALVEAVISEGTTYLGNGAFNGCTSLSAIALPASLTTISNEVFADCPTGLVIYVPAGSAAHAWAVERGYTVEIIQNETDAADFTYEIADEAVTITGYTGEGGAVTIPATIEGYPVTAIGSWILGEESGVTSLVIPEGVTSIGMRAFIYCGSLTSVTLPSTLTDIGANAFYYTGLTEVTIPASVTTIGRNAFGGCHSLTAFVVEEGNTAYKSVDGMLLTADGTTLLCWPSGKSGECVIPDGVTMIEYGAFLESNPSGIYIPASVTTIYEGTFGSCFGLAAITVEEGNEKYTSVGGVLYTKDMTALLNYPSAKTGELLEIPEDVTRIGNEAVRFNSNLRTVIVPDSVTEIGDMAFSSCESITSITLPETLDYLGFSAFDCCYALESIVLPTNLTEIPDGLLSCTSITELSIPESVTRIGWRAIFGCMGLTKVTVPEGVIEIDGYAFERCENLVYITLPSTLTEIGEGILDDCAENLVVAVTEGSYAHEWAVAGGYTVEIVEAEENATPAEYFTYTAYDTFVTITGYTGTDTEIVVPSRIGGLPVTSIGSQAFYRSAITGITLPKYLTGIGSNAFYGCEALTSVALPASLTSISSNAFSHCTSLTGIIIPAAVSSMGSLIFYGCNALTAIHVEEGNAAYKSVDGVVYSADGATLHIYPAGRTDANYAVAEGVTTIADYAFAASQLTAISLPASLTSISRNAALESAKLAAFNVAADNATYASVDGVLFDKAMTTLLLYPTAKAGAPYVIPDGVTEIGSYAFYYTTAVSEVIIPASTTAIGSNAFSNADALTAIAIPNTVTSLGEYAFYDCDALASVTLPEGMTSIPNSAFYSCSMLTAIDLPSTITSIGRAAFQYAGLVEVTIPEGVTTIDTYAFRYCRSLRRIILPESLTTMGSSVLGNNASPMYVVVVEGSYAHEWAESNNYNVEIYCAEGEVTPAANFSYTISNGEVSINDYNGGASSIIIPETIEDCPVTALGDYAMVEADTLKSVILPGTLETIGYRVLAGSGIESINIPASVTSIQSYALVECESLTEITVDDANTVFSDIDGVLFRGTTLFIFPIAKQVGEYAIPEGTTGIDYPGMSESMLTRAIVPASVSYINNYGFHNNVNLAEIVVDESNSYFTSVDGVLLNKAKTLLIDYPIGSSATEYAVPDGVTELNYFAFYNAANLESVALPEGLTDIGADCFMYCSGLKSLALPDTVTNVEEYAFAHCTSLESIKLSGGLTRLGLNILYQCSSLKSIEIPSAVTSISEYALGGCSSLTELVIPEGVTTIGRYAFSGCTGLTRVTLPESLYSIASTNVFNDIPKTQLTLVVPDGSYAHSWAEENGYTVELTGGATAEDFNYTIADGEVTIDSYFGSPTRVVIPDTIEGYPVTAIGDEAFVCCSQVVTVTIPEGVTTIGKSVFNICDNLVSASIPASAVNIGGNVFMFCPKLESVTVAEGNAAYKSVDGVLFTADGVRLITFPGGKGTEYVIPEGTTELAFHAFSGVSALKKVTLPATLEEIDASFYSADSLAAFDVASGNPLYKAVDGVLMSADGTCILSYPCAKTDRDYAIPEGVTDVYGETFTNAQYLTTLTIPVSATMVSSAAASYAGNLTEFKVAEGSESYAAVDGVLYSKDLTTLCAYPYGKYDLEYTIPDGTVEIESYVFIDLFNLMRVTIPESVTAIGEGAFMDEDLEVCVYAGSAAETLLTNMGCAYKLVSEPMETEASSFTYTIADGAATITGYTGTDAEVVVPALIEDCPVTAIAASAFKSSIVSRVTLPDTVTSIGDYAFRYCSTLITVDMPASLTSIGTYAFQNCIALKALKLPEGLTTIGTRAFSGCSALLSIEIPSTVTVLEPYVFGSCDSLRQVVLNDGLTTISNHALYTCSSLMAITIPETVTSIGNHAFYLCSSLTELTIPGSVTSVGNYAFCNCSGLIRASVNEGVTSLGYYAFSGCSSLLEIDLPASLTSIGSSAFLASDNVTIYVSEGSYAETYCASNGYNYETCVG